MKRIQSQQGFTLVEIIIVIAIMGIIGGLSSLIIGRSLDSYTALERRTDLQMSIRLAVERISRELRHALPHSLCVNNGAGCLSSGNRFYFIPVKDSGRYQDRPGVYVVGPPIQRDRIKITGTGSSQFDVLSTNNQLSGANRINAAIGDWVSIYNLNNIDVYAGTNDVRKRINNIILKDINNDGDNTTDIDQIQFAGNERFANHSPSRRFHVIQNDVVTLFYLDGTDLKRDTTSFATPNTATVNTRLLMQNVQACNFTYTAGSPQRAGLLRIDITVTQQGESIQVIHDSHVYNTP